MVFFLCIWILNFHFKMKCKENLKYMLVVMFMFNTHVVYDFYVDHYNISSNDTQLKILCNYNVYSFLYTRYLNICLKL